MRTTTLARATAVLSLTLFAAAGQAAASARATDTSEVPDRGSGSPAPATPSSSSQRISFNIPRQPLSEALTEWSRQSGLQVLRRDTGDTEITTAEVSGMYSPAEALDRMLAETGLRYEFVNDRTVRIDPIPAGAAAPNVVSPATSSDTDQSGSWLAEVIVTATKRAERLQDVPISVAAVSAQEIDRRGLVSAEDYLRGIPGVNQVTQAFNTQSIVIRGLETSPSDQNFSSGTTVATYFGETPTTNSAGISGGANVDIKLVDVERVEVLRGPQGTAFGNSALGGAVRTIPVAPKLNLFEGKVAASYSVTSGVGGDNHSMQAVGNVPLIDDKLAVRAAVYQFEDSGIYRNRAGFDPLVQALAGFFGAQAFATDADDVGASNFTGGRVAASFKPTEDLRLTLSYLRQTTEVDGFGLANTGLYQQGTLQVAPEHVRRRQRGGLFDTEIDIANATLEYDLGWGNLVATYSHLESQSTQAYPFSSIGGFDGVPASQFADSDHREDSGEIRLTTQFDGAWNFLAGLYAEQLDDDSDFDLVWYGSLDTNFFGAARYLGDYHDVRELRQKAAFAEVSWNFLPAFTLTGGARAYDYERSGEVESTGFFGNAATNMDADASGTSFRANLSYKPTDDALVYASWSQGFRLGKPQPGLPSGVCDINGDGIVDGTGGVTIESTRSLDSDEVDNYEIGSKLTLLDERVTLAVDVFHIDWSGVPVRTGAPPPPEGCNLTYNANVGAAVSEGVELQASFRVTRDIRVDLGGSKIRARLDKDAPRLNQPAFKGDRLPGSPSVNANLGVQYEFDVGGHPAYVRADSIYVGTFHGDFQESPQTRSGGYVKVDASARVALRNLNIDLFVRNLTDADDFTFRGTSTANGSFFGYRLRPRTVGVQLGYNF